MSFNPQFTKPFADVARSLQVPAVNWSPRASIAAVRAIDGLHVDIHGQTHVRMPQNRLNGFVVYPDGVKVG
jgi:hypothetical protein